MVSVEKLLERYLYSTCLWHAAGFTALDSYIAAREKLDGNRYDAFNSMAGRGSLDKKKKSRTPIRPDDANQTGIDTLGVRTRRPRIQSRSVSRTRLLPYVK
jgi:hypothetical protein